MGEELGRETDPQDRKADQEEITGEGRWHGSGNKRLKRSVEIATFTCFHSTVPLQEEKVQ
jgi:hypothetical protein